MTVDTAQQRLSNQHISGERFENPEDVVRWMGAMQAQDYHQALWAIGVRTKSSTVAEIEQAIIDRKILRTWPMRGTIHFVPPDDAAWMLKLCAVRMIAKDARRQQQLELDKEILGRCQDLICDALQGGKRLSRPDLLKVLDDVGIHTQNQRGYHILWYLSQIGVICPGPNIGKQQSFVLLEEWVPNSRVLSREESLGELAGRYFASHGPATIHDFAWWTGLTVSDARIGLEAAKSKLIAEQVNGKTYWLADNTTVSSENERFFLLPGFDEYLLGYKDRSAVLADEHVLKVVPGKNGIFFPIIVADGQVVGTWKRNIKKKSVDISLSPFDDTIVALNEAAQRYSDFIGLPLSSS